MKVRFTIDEVLDGYTNINPFDESQLDELSNNECSYIFCDNCIRGCTFENLEENLNKWCSKLRLGGIINIVGVELSVLVSRYIYEEDLKSFNSVISESNGIFSIMSIKEILEKNNLKIVSLNINNDYYCVEATR